MHTLIVSECDTHPPHPDGRPGRAYTLRTASGDEVHCCGDWDFSPDLELGSYSLHLDEQHDTLELDAPAQQDQRSVTS